MHAHKFTRWFYPSGLKHRHMLILWFHASYGLKAWTGCAWRVGLGIGNTNMAKRVDLEHFFHMYG